MELEGYTVDMTGDRVEVRARGTLAGSGRWRAGHVQEREGTLDGATWNAVELAVRREAEAWVAAESAAAYDERGVDVTQIDRMLALSPAERLDVLYGQCVAILELAGHVPRD